MLSHIRSVKLGTSEEYSTSEGRGESEEMQGVVECYQEPMRYKDFLMLSEWLVEVPEDFATTYLALSCPVGKRCLVVAGSGCTYMYLRNGKCMERFNSVLPGGSPLTGGSGSYAILDCVANYTENVFYVLDLVVWVNQPMMQC